MTQTKPKARSRKPGKRLTALKTTLVAAAMGLTIGTWGILTSPNVQASQAVMDAGGSQVTIAAPASPTAALVTPLSPATVAPTAQPTTTATAQPTATATATVQPTATAQPTATVTAPKPTTAPAPVARTRSSK